MAKAPPPPPKPPEEPPLSLEDIGRVKGGRVRDPFGPEPVIEPPPEPRPILRVIPDEPEPPAEAGAPAPAPKPVGGPGGGSPLPRMGLRSTEGKALDDPSGPQPRPEPVDPPPRVDDGLRWMMPLGRRGLRPTDRAALEDPSGPQARPSPPVEGPREDPGQGMGWLQTGGRFGLRPAPEDLVDSTSPDTSAYRRPSAQEPPGHVLSPRVAETARSPMEGASAVPVLPSARRGEGPAAPPLPTPASTSEVQGPIPWTVVISSPAPGQVCPRCKGPLRILRTRREERLEMSWFRLEWWEIERGIADCPKHPEVESEPLGRPAFRVPASRMGNGLLARVACWRWQDHMPAHEIARLVGALGLRCSERRVGEWLALAHEVIAPAARRLRAAATGPADELGIILGEPRREGRLRARTGGGAVAFTWTEGHEGPRPDMPEERARHVLLDARGLSQAGRQATLRRAVAPALATRRDLAARLLWQLEELRLARDGQAERALLARIQAQLQGETDPHLHAARTALEVFGVEGLCRFDARGRPAPLPSRPENVRAVLPSWLLLPVDGRPEGVADWLTVMESATAAGVSAWPWLRDRLRGAAEGEDPAKAPLPGAA